MFKKKFLLLVLIPIFLVATIGLSAAATARAVEFDEDGRIEEGEVIDDDLFIGGDTVVINGTVNGDVFAAGSVVNINGTINGSLATGAQSIRLNGDVAGSVYAGSSTLTLESEAEIDRNMYYGGFNLTTAEGSLINRDLLVGAYQALLSGEVGRNVRAGVGALEVDGKIGNDLLAEVGSPDDEGMPPMFASPPGVETIVPVGIRISESAEIGGAISYKSASDQSAAIAISPPGGVEFEYDPQLDSSSDPDDAGQVGSAALVGRWVLKRIRVLITLTLLGGLIVWQIPGLLVQVGDKIRQETMPSLGWGLVVYLVVYMGAFLIAGLVIAAAIFFGVITLGELSKVILTAGFSSLGLVLAGFGLLVSYGSKLVVSYLVGRLILKWLAPSYDDQPIWAMLLGVFLYAFLRAIPGLGFLIGAAATLIGIGAMWLVYRDRFPGAAAAQELSAVE